MLRGGGKNTQNCTKKDLHDPDHNWHDHSPTARHPGM